MSLEKYNRIYSEDDTAFSSTETEKIISDILEYKNSGTVLDLGSGPGGDAIFLAKNGFAVTAVDQSDIVVGKINQRSIEEKLDIRAEVSDIKSFNLQGPYDVIICKRTLHNLSQEDGLELIEKIKGGTANGGLNIIAAFTQDGDFFRLDIQEGRFYLKKEELRSLYSDWEILEYNETEGQALTKKPDGKNMVNISAKLIARKI